jgi:hypothetical protein
MLLRDGIVTPFSRRFLVLIIACGCIIGILIGRITPMTIPVTRWVVVLIGFVVACTGILSVWCGVYAAVWERSFWMACGEMALSGTIAVSGTVFVAKAAGLTRPILPAAVPGAVSQSAIDTLERRK